ncbi:MAG: S8 family serine peptidase [Actinomycetota bacterium]
MAAATGRVSPARRDSTTSAPAPRTDRPSTAGCCRTTPGQNVMSTRATNGVLCGLPGSTQETPPSPLHAPCTGTSMASPHVSGGYAVFVEWFRKNLGGTPSPALVKAAFVNGAIDLSRRDGVDADGEPLTTIPNNQQGWGRFSLGRTIKSWRKGAVRLDQSVVFTDSGQSRSLRIEPIRARRPLKATLVWTDAPGHGKGGELPAWVNDLNLIVRGGGTNYRGNAFEDGWSVGGGKADRMNNVENVYLRRGGDKRYRVTVKAANIIGDALPNHKGATDQDFALVVTNARLVRP